MALPARKEYHDQPQGREQSQPTEHLKREQVFESIASIKKRSRVVDCTERVLQHSVEDGLVLADRVHLSNTDLAEAVISPAFIIKHPNLFIELMHGMLDSRSLQAIDSNPANKPIFNRMVKSYKELLAAQKSGDWEEFSEGVEHVRGRLSKDKKANEIDDYYAPLLQTRRFIPVVTRNDFPPGEQVKGMRGEMRQLKSAEELADETLRQYERLLRPAYYMLTVEDILKKYLKDHKLPGEPLKENLAGNYFASDDSGFYTVKEAIIAECDRLGIPFDEIESPLRTAKYTSVTVNIKSAEAERGIIKKLNKSLEDSGRKVELVDGKYEVIDIEKKEEEEEELVESDRWDDEVREEAERISNSEIILNGRKFICSAERIFLKNGPAVTDKFESITITNRPFFIERIGRRLKIHADLLATNLRETQEVDLDVDKIRQLEAEEKKKSERFITVEGGESLSTPGREEEYFDFPNKRVKVVTITRNPGDNNSQEQFFEVDGKRIGGGWWRPYYRITKVQYDKEKKELIILGYRNKEESIQQVEKGQVVTIEDELARELEGTKPEKKESVEIDGKFLGNDTWQLGGMKIRLMEINNGDECVFVDADTSYDVTEEFPGVYDVKDITYTNGVIFFKCKRISDNLLMTSSIETTAKFQGQIAADIKKIEGEDKEKKESDFEKFEERSLDYLEKLLSHHGNNGSDDYYIASNLAVFDSKRANQLRAELLKQKDKFEDSVLAGLAGIDSDEAWRMRDEVFNNWNYETDLVISLAGLDNERAWQMRVKLLEKIENDDYPNKDFRIFPLKRRLLNGLAGLNSELAWQMRDDFYAGKYNFEQQFQFGSLRGLDNERAWQMRDKLMKADDVKNINKIFESLAGLDSARAWQLRDDYMNSHKFIEDVGFVKMDEVDVIIQSLAGLDDERAWQMRNNVIRLTQHLDKSKQVKRRIAEYCTGLNSAQAWKLRDEIIDDDGRSLAKSFAHTEYTWLLLKFRDKKEESKELTEEEQKQLELINLLRHPTLEGIYQEFGGIKSEIEEKLAKKKGLRDLFSSSPVVSSILSKLIKTDPKLFIETMAAKRDRALTNVFAEKIAQKIFPEIKKVREQDTWRGFSGYAGLGGGSPERGKSQTQDLLRPNSDFQLMGGGFEGLNNDREIMEFRDTVEGLVATDIYGHYNPNSKRWEKSKISIDAPLTEPIIETTATIPNIKNLNQVSLPKPLEAMIIPERVKGFDVNGQEYDLKIEVSSSGESKVVDKPKEVEKIVYSLSISSVPAPMEDLSVRDYQSYKKQLEVVSGRDLTTEISGLPEDLELELIDIIKGKNPKEQVETIERFVRNLGYYDQHNEEVNRLKADKPLEEQLYIMEQRLEELKQKNPDSNEYDGKRFAGVCADFAQVTTILLRRAGFASGVVSGFGGVGKKVSMKNAHATSFVLWPDKEGYNRVISIDGTPDGVEGISLPSLVEREAEVAGKEKELSNVATREIQKIIENLNSLDVETVRKMSNGELERTLNSILKYQVKESQLAIIEKLFDFYWYTPIHKLDLDNRYQRSEAILELVGAVERQRKRLANQPEKDTIPAGNKLMQVMQDFLRRFEVAGVSENKYAAIDLMERIVDLVKNDLSEVEQKAAFATIAYLKAKNILGDK